MSSSHLVPPLCPGMTVRTRAIFPFPLPKGLGEGVQVKVVHQESDRCIVLDAKNREWCVPAVLLDAGQMIWSDGGWVPEGKAPAESSRNSANAAA